LEKERKKVWLNRTSETAEFENTLRHRIRLGENHQEGRRGE